MSRYLVFAVMILATVLVSVSPAVDVNVDDLIKQLDADKFADRRAASQQLEEMGKSVFPELAEASKSPSREVSTRALAILKHYFENGESETKTAAEAALKALSESDDTAVARRAAQALRPPEDPNKSPLAPRGIQFLPGQIQLQVQAVQGLQGVNRIKMRLANGVKDLEVEENGRKVKIHEGPDGIKVEVTEKNGAKKKYEAKNVIDLKKRHPDGHKIYEKYQQNQGGLQIMIGGLKRRPLPVPAIPQNRAKGLDQSQQNLDKMIERLRKRIGDNPQNAKQYQRMIESIEQHKKRLDELKKRLGGEPKPKAGEQTG